MENVVYAQMAALQPYGVNPADVPAEGAIVFATFDGDAPVADVLTSLTDPNGAWPATAADAAPLWIACSDKTIEDAIAAFYNIPVRQIAGLNM
jgi:hypothetical protein